MSMYTERLRKMQGTVDEQMTDYVPGGFILLAPGEYDANVTAALGETKNDPKRLQVVWTFVVASGEKQGKKVFDRTIIEDNKVGLQICRSRIEDLGQDWPGRIAGIEPILETISLVAPLVRIRVTHENSTGKDGKKYTNARVRVIDVLDGSDPVPESDDTSTSAVETASVDPILDGLLTLCNSYQLDYVKDDMDIAAIVAALKDHDVTFACKDLMADELAVLDAVGPELVEGRPEPVKPARRVLVTPSSPARAPASAKNAGNARKPAKGRSR